MKQIELSLKKRLLIVEPENDQLEKSLMFADFEGKELSFICKGNDLSEDKLKNFITKGWNFTRVEIFISHLFSNGFNWNNNPEDKFINNELNKYWFEEEQNNFNPDRTIIFEIL